MKKSILILGAMSIMAISLNSCGPSACDCIEKSQKLMQEATANPSDKSLHKKAMDFKKQCNKYTKEDFENC